MRKIPHLLHGLTIDIGRVNFAMYIEEIDAHKLRDLKLEYKKIPYKERTSFSYNGHKSMEKIRDKLSMLGKRILIDVQNFTSYVGQPYDDEVRKNLLKYLKLKEEIFQGVNIILIEKQYHNPRARGGGKSNIDALTMGEFVYAYFFMKIQEGFFYNHPVLMYYPSKYKTEMWNAPLKMAKPQRKIWSGKTALSILDKRGDVVGLKELKTKGIKKDDMGDCLLMWLTFLCYYYLYKGKS